ncbi:MAG: cytochrome c family protein [Candidatus Dadabacteria bacterium]|nr:cytochrome c family protein [Candidatus Dadabacteria bacterium]
MMKKLLKLCSGVLLLILVFLGLYLYTAESSTKAPVQPVLFSHKIHAGENQIPCQYCHSYVTESSMPGIPSVQKCMGCHSYIPGKDVEYIYDGKSINMQKEIEKVKKYWDNKQPIPWTRVNYLADFVYFTHKRHVLRGIECATCHGDVASMDVVKRAHKLEMGWCVTCHEANAKDEMELARLKDCLTCHK